MTFTVRRIQTSYISQLSQPRQSPSAVTISCNKRSNTKDLRSGTMSIHEGNKRIRLQGESILLHNITADISKHKNRQPTHFDRDIQPPLA